MPSGQMSVQQVSEDQKEDESDFIALVTFPAGGLELPQKAESLGILDQKLDTLFVQQQLFPDSGDHTQEPIGIL